MKKIICCITYLLVLSLFLISCNVGNESGTSTTSADVSASEEASIENDLSEAISSTDETPFQSDFIKGMKLENEEWILGKDADLAAESFDSEKAFVRVTLKNLDSKGLCEIPDSENVTYSDFYLSIAEIEVKEVYTSGAFTEVKAGDVMRIIVPASLEDETVKMAYSDEYFEKYKLIFSFPAVEVGKEYIMYIGNVIDSVLLERFSDVSGEDISAFASYSYPLFTDDFTKISYMNEQNIATVWGEVYVLFYDAYIKEGKNDNRVETWLYNCIKRGLNESETYGKEGSVPPLD